ncbi:AfsR/SARP family transcriptional regulator [Streptomyces sp. A012304]|uniref:AfsR/SARP family transcriptional regulator n=1 Tax=Streptomyces sp. A012304 TaxID=375446 RepID=UPI00223135C9|nr:AfsR/SARP family transcriptional regulator [Streptomyces sp. A012304]
MPTAPTFAMLGPLRAHMSGTELDLGPVRQQAVLTTLLCNANRVVTSAELLKAVWGQDLPSSGAKLIPPYIYRLRRLLASASDEPGKPFISTSREGYVIHLDSGQLDTERFHRTVGLATESQTHGQLEQASSLLSTALDDWYGEPLAGLPGPFADSQRRHLTERRVSAIERRIGIDLQLGRHEAVIPELAALLAAHPLREHLATMLMTALCQNHRQADALAVFTRTRTLLVEQLGMEPGAELRAAYEAVLHADVDTPQPDSPAPRLTTAVVSASLAPSGAAHGTGRCDLPHVAATFVGRRRELDSLLRTGLPDGGTGRGTVVDVIDGMPGSGKTSLAVQAAWTLTSRYPDGCLFLDLHGHTPGRRPLSPDDALSVLLRALGAGDQDKSSLDEKQGVLRTALADRRVLLLLDDAHDAHQVRPLLPGGPLCRVVITSRKRLIGLESTTVLSLDVLPPSDAAEMFTAIVGADRIGGDTHVVSRVVELCGRLPLAIRIAADKMVHRPSWGLSDVYRRLAESVDGISFFRAGIRNLEEALLQSYARLSEREKDAFHTLSTAPYDDFDDQMAARLTGSPVRVTQEDLDQLLDANLMQQPSPNTFRFHDLVRRYARTAMPTADEAPSGA